MVWSGRCRAGGRVGSVGGEGPAASLSTAPSTAPSTGPLAVAARLYLVLLPVGHLVVIPLGGAIATGADLALGGLLAAGAVAEAERRLGGASHVVARPDLSYIGVTKGLALLASFGVWVALSGVWGYHPRYAIFKGAGYLALAAGAWLLARSGAGWRSLVEAWLVGCVVALALVVVGAAGPEALTARVLYDGDAVRGLPIPRVSGPFLHPSMMGGYLAVSGVLLWGVWPDLSPAARRAGRVAATLGAVVLVLTVSTGWVSAGVAASLLGRDSALATRPRVASVLRLGGALVVLGALVGVLVPLELEVGGWSIRVGAVRPAIWASALAAVSSSPLIGVGAAPFLARAPHPMGGPGPYLWDAHQAYLSVLGQFGVVGAALMGAGIALVARALLGAPPSRYRAATLAALSGVAAHAFLVANEDFRHLWALLGLAGAVGVGAAASPQEDA